MLIEFSSLIFPLFFPPSPLFLLQGGGGSGGAAGGLKFTVADTCERIKEEFNFIQQQNHSWVFLFSFTRLSTRLLSLPLCFSFPSLSSIIPLQFSRLFIPSRLRRVRVSPRSTIIDADASPAFPRLPSPVSRSLRGIPIPSLASRCCTPISLPHTQSL